MTKIRKYKEKDKEQIKELITKTLHEIFNVSPPENVLEDIERIKQEYFENTGIFYVTIKKGKIIGTIAIKKQDNKTAKLKRMYVDRDYRKTGIAQKLMKKIFRFCKKKGYEKIILSTCPEMKSAIRFYKKHGFKEVKRNKKKNQIFFEKELNIT